mmetsp:Transcript_82550/g.159472  ORF Transcript_82550/g.159472 Transcript_82550/m.159472 type:complete len:180 (-) Transcript_82550:142-681(-)
MRVQAPPLSAMSLSTTAASKLQLRRASSTFLVVPVVLTLSYLAPFNTAEVSSAWKSFADTASASLRSAFPSPIQEVEPHLIGFYAEQSMEAKRMKYLGDLLEKELPGTKIVWLEAWQNPLNERLRATIDLRNQCGGVPYLFNRKTGKVLCGVVAYDKLRLWAQGLGGDARIYRDMMGGE